MIKLTVNNLWAHKRRLTATLLAIGLGIAFLSGTLVLGDTLNRSFDSTFEHVYRGTDAMIRSKSALGNGLDAAEQRPPLPASLVERVRAVPGVAAVIPEIGGLGQIVGSDGKTIGGGGPPTFVESWSTDPAMNPYKLVEGHAPRGTTEVVVNRGAAKKGNFGVGDRITILTPDPLKVSVVGVATFDGRDSSSGANVAAFSLAGAEAHLLARPNTFDDIVVRAESGVSSETLATGIRAVLPKQVETVTHRQLVDEAKKGINDDFLGFFKTFLLMFAGIAVLVASFSIYNTFSIIVAQRGRESALLRAIGAGRRQVLASTVVESIAVGMVASTVGLFAGFGIAALLMAAFGAFGADLPSNGLVFLPGTAVVSMSVGMLVTFLAGVVPSIRAARVPPLAALRDVAVEPATVSRRRVLLGGAALALGSGLVVASALDWAGSLATAGLGAVVTLLGMVVIGPAAAGPFTRVTGSALGAVRGMPARLAKGNAMRSPRRTSATAGALMVGVAVVVLFTVFAASIKASVQQSIDRSFGGDLVIMADADGGNGLAPSVAKQVADLPSVANAVGVGFLPVRLATSNQEAAVADPSAMSQVVDLDVASGSVTGDSRSKLAVSRALADAEHWSVGSRVPALFADGGRETLTVGSIYRASDIAGDVIVPVSVAAAHQIRPTDTFVAVKLARGVTLPEGRAAVESVTDRYANAKVQDRDQYIAQVASQVNQVLAVIYVLLALAIVIALMGIANTLALSVHERTRELGLLRAVGQTRSQVRSMVRWESVLVALFGSVGGIGIGVFLGWALVKAAGRSQGLVAFAVPGGQLAIVLAVAAGAGVLAAVRPARRAAKLDVLTAIATD